MAETSGLTPPTVVDSTPLTASASSSVWDRISTWASEHKAAVYTIAGVTLVVTGAGAVYYFSGPKPVSDEAFAERKKARKDKKKAKKEAERNDKAEPEKGPAAEGRINSNIV